MTTRTYHVSDSIVFRKTKEEFGGLSNMAAGYSLRIHDIIIPTAEHLYQSCRFPDYPTLQWDIITERSPMKAKWIGRANIKLTRPDWEQHHFKVMQWALELKLSQNWEPFSQLLLSTGNKNIVELTPKPKIWGAVKDGEYLVGTNALGRLLMYMREKFAKTNIHRKCIQPLDIPDFNFLGFPIDVICDENDEYEIANTEREFILSDN